MASRINRELAATLARYCELVYPAEGEATEAETQVRIDQQLLPHTVQHFNKGGTQAFVVTTPEHRALVFRGTQVSRRWSWEDIVRNVKVALVGWEGSGRAHKGYVKGLMAVWSDIKKQLQEVQQPIYVTGHSLGGVTATLAASLWDFDACYTFGAPRPGDRAFWRSVRCPVYRFHHAWDIAPTWPPYLTGYRQGGERWKITRRGKVKQRRAFPWELSPLPVGPLRVLDHGIGEYRLKLKGAEI